MPKPELPDRQIDAEFDVNRTEMGYEIVLESRGGDRRNTGYSEGLGLILRRLADAGATIVGAEVRSGPAMKLAPPERAVRFTRTSLPTTLQSDSDVEPLRSDLMAGQRRVGQRDGATGGNSTKRLAIVVRADEPLGDVHTLRRLLVGPAAGGRNRNYGALREMLEARSGAQVTLTLDEISQLVGDDLSRMAANHQFWADVHDGQLARRPQQRAWRDAGFFRALVPRRSSRYILTSSARDAQRALRLLGVRVQPATVGYRSFPSERMRDRHLGCAAERQGLFRGRSTRPCSRRDRQPHSGRT